MLKNFFKIANLKCNQHLSFAKNFFNLNILPLLQEVKVYRKFLNLQLTPIFNDLDTFFKTYNHKPVFLENFFAKTLKFYNSQKISTIQLVYAIILLFFFNKINMDLTNLTNLFLLNIKKFGFFKLFVVNFHNFIPKIDGFGFLCPYIFFQNIKNSHLNYYIDTFIIILPFLTLFLFFFITSINFFNKQNNFLTKNKKFSIKKKFFTK